MNRMNQHSKGPMSNATKRRVAAYARVSTDTEEQLTSYQAQVDHYTKYIKSKEEWDFVEVYADEGVSAINTKRRDGFNRMVADAMAGKIDLIITKSVSRFARNTVDTLTTVRLLKEKGVEVYFEKEDLHTLDAKGEFLISILGSLAQEEARAISANVTWGTRKQFADGKIRLPYKHFLGYAKGPDGYPQMIEKEAETIRLIYQLFLKGDSPFAIARHLSCAGIPTPGHKANWRHQTVRSILTNEKYKGDAILQKSVTIDFISKVTKKNEGEAPQYYVENSHAPIISKDLFDIVQFELKRRKDSGKRLRSDHRFTVQIICGQCGSAYGRNVWAPRGKAREIQWTCRNRAQSASACHSPHIREEVLEHAFRLAIEELIHNQSDILSEYGCILQTLSDTTATDLEITRHKKEIDGCAQRLRRREKGRAETASDQKSNQGRDHPLRTRLESLQTQLNGLNEERQEQLARSYYIRLFLDQLKAVDPLETESDPDLWHALVDSVIVQSAGILTFAYKSGLRMDIDISGGEMQQTQVSRRGGFHDTDTPGS